MSAARRSRTMSFVTTANTSRSPWRILSRAAKAAADAVRVTYSKNKPNVAPISSRMMTRTCSTLVRPGEAPAKRARRCRGAFANAPVKLDQTYVTPAETHNPIELQATTAIWDGENADALRGVAGDLQHAQRPRANVWFAERKRPRHHEVRWLGFWEQALAMDALPARRCGGAATRQTGEARAQSQDDVSIRRSSPADSAASAARRHAGGKTRFAPARLCLPPIDARRSPRELRRSDAVPLQCAESSGKIRARET